MELNNTIILPCDNDDLSKRLLTSLVQMEDVITVIIFGRDANAEDAVKKADVRGGAVVAGFERKIAWMQNTALLIFLSTLIKEGEGGRPDSINIQEHIGIAISLTDKLMDKIPLNPSPDFIRMELAFITASKV